MRENLAARKYLRLQYIYNICRHEYATYQLAYITDCLRYLYYQLSVRLCYSLHMHPQDEDLMNRRAKRAPDNECNAGPL